MELTLSKINREIAQCNTNLKNYKNRQSRLETEIKKIEDKIANNEKKIDDLQKQLVTTNTSPIRKVWNAIKNLFLGTQNSLNETIENLRTTIEKLKKELETNKKNKDDLERDIEEETTKMENLEEQKKLSSRRKESKSKEPIDDNNSKENNYEKQIKQIVDIFKELFEKTQYSNLELLLNDTRKKIDTASIFDVFDKLLKTKDKKRNDVFNDIFNQFKKQGFNVPDSIKKIFSEYFNEEEFPWEKYLKVKNDVNLDNWYKSIIAKNSTYCYNNSSPNNKMELYILFELIAVENDILQEYVDSYTYSTNNLQDMRETEAEKEKKDFGEIGSSNNSQDISEETDDSFENSLSSFNDEKTEPNNNLEKNAKELNDIIDKITDFLEKRGETECWEVKFYINSSYKIIC